MQVLYQNSASLTYAGLYGQGLKRGLTRTASRLSRYKTDTTLLNSGATGSWAEVHSTCCETFLIHWHPGTRCGIADTDRICDNAWYACQPNHAGTQAEGYLKQLLAMLPPETYNECMQALRKEGTWSQIVQVRSWALCRCHSITALMPVCAHGLL